MALEAQAGRREQNEQHGLNLPSSPGQQYVWLVRPIWAQTGLLAHVAVACANGVGGSLGMTSPV